MVFPKYHFKGLGDIKEDEGQQTSMFCVCHLYSSSIKACHAPCLPCNRVSVSAYACPVLPVEQERHSADASQLLVYSTSLHHSQLNVQ